MSIDIVYVKHCYQPIPQSRHFKKELALQAYADLIDHRVKPPRQSVVNLSFAPESSIHFRFFSFRVQIAIISSHVDRMTYPLPTYKMLISWHDKIRRWHGQGGINQPCGFWVVVISAVSTKNERRVYGWSKTIPR